MKIKKRTFWPLAVLTAFLALLLGSDAFARGGRGGGFGGGGLGGGRGGRGMGRGGGGGRTGSGNKAEDERRRRDERLARVAQARLVYAQRERQKTWEAEAEERRIQTLRRILDSTSE